MLVLCATLSITSTGIMLTEVVCRVKAGVVTAREGKRNVSKRWIEKDEPRHYRSFASTQETSSCDVHKRHQADFNWLHVTNSHPFLDTLMKRYHPTNSRLTGMVGWGNKGRSGDHKKRKDEKNTSHIEKDDDGRWWLISFGTLRANGLWWLSWDPKARSCNFDLVQMAGDVRWGPVRTQRLRQKSTGNCRSLSSSKKLKRSRRSC